MWQLWENPVPERRLAPIAEKLGIPFRCTDHNECLQSYCREVSRGE